MRMLSYQATPLSLSHGPGPEALRHWVALSFAYLSVPEKIIGHWRNNFNTNVLHIWHADCTSICIKIECEI